MSSSLVSTPARVPAPSRSAALARPGGRWIDHWLDTLRACNYLGEREPADTSSYGLRGNGIVRHFGESYEEVVLVGGFSKAMRSSEEA